MQQPYVLEGIASQQRAIQSDLYQIGVGIEGTQQLLLRVERERRRERAAIFEAAVRAENIERQRVKHTPNAVRYDEDGNLVAAGPTVTTVMMDRATALLPERLHRVPEETVMLEGTELPLYALTVPRQDVINPYSYRSHITGSRVIADFNGEGYSDVQWFPFQDKFKAALRYDGALLGTKDGIRHVLAGVRVVAESTLGK